MNYHIGTSGYSYPKWKGSFYPAKFPAKQMLGFYAARFRTVEINNTFYRAPTAAVLKAWADQVPVEFRFVLTRARGRGWLHGCWNCSPRRVQERWRNRSGPGRVESGPAEVDILSVRKRHMDRDLGGLSPLRDAPIGFPE